MQYYWFTVKNKEAKHGLVHLTIDLVSLAQGSAAPDNLPEAPNERALAPGGSILLASYEEQGRKRSMVW
jgi:hypothetical protein